MFLESAAAMGGVQFSTLYLAQSLADSRWQPIVVCPTEGDLTHACRDANIETRVIAYPRMWSTSVRVGRSARLPNLFAWTWNALVLLRATFLIRKFLRKTEPEVLVTKGLQSHFIGGLAARRLSTTCVWHVQDHISERNFGIYRRIFALAARRVADRIIVDGAAIKGQLPSSMQPRTSIVHNGVDTCIFSPDSDGSEVRRELGISPDQLVIGHAARITPWKGQHYLIEAFAQFASQHPNVVVLFVGSPVFDHDAYEQRLRSMATEFGLEHRIKFAGYRHDLPNALAAMDIFAFTSIEKDTTPLALLSAMSTGLPIVAFDIEGVTEISEGDEILAVVPVSDSKSLAQSLSSLLEDYPLRSRLGQNARRLAERRFSLRQYVSRMEIELVNACGFQSRLARAKVTDSPELVSRSSSEKTSAVSAVGSKVIKRPKILFVHNALSEFVRLDLEELRTSFDVTARVERSRFVNPFGLWRAVRDHDLVFGWFASWHTFLPVQFAKLLGKPSILVVGGYDVANMPQIGYGHQRGGLKKWISGRAMRLATRLITNSDYSRQEVARHVGITNGSVARIYHGVPDKFGSLSTGKRESLALTVGNVNRSNLLRKGHEPFVRAAASLPEVKFVLVGSWQDDAINHLRKIATPNVEFTGRVTDEALLDYYRRASVYVQTSLHEGFGMSVAEGMLAGCVPVTTRLGALPEVTGDAGVFVDSTEPSAIAEGIRKAIDSSQAVRASCRKRILEQFRLANRGRDLERIISAALESRAS